MPTIPVEFSAYETGEAYEPTGAIGRDTESILMDLGYTKKQVEELRASGAAK